MERERLKDYRLLFKERLIMLMLLLNPFKGAKAPVLVWELKPKR